MRSSQRNSSRGETLRVEREGGEGKRPEEHVCEKGRGLVEGGRGGSGVYTHGSVVGLYCRYIEFPSSRSTDVDTRCYERRGVVGFYAEYPIPMR